MSYVTILGEVRRSSVLRLMYDHPVDGAAAGEFGVHSRTETALSATTRVSVLWVTMEKIHGGLGLLEAKG